MPTSSRIPPTGDLHISRGPGLPRGLVVPERELVERFSHSPGAGGQSVNTADSRVELRWDVAASDVLTEAQRARLLARLRLTTDGTVSVTCVGTSIAVAQPGSRQAAAREADCYGTGARYRAPADPAEPGSAGGPRG